MKKSPVAKAYAKALYLTAIEKKSIDDVRAQLKAFCDLLYVQNNGLLQVFKAKTFTANERQKLMDVIADATGLDKALKKLVGLLVKRERLLILEQILEAYDAINDAANNIVRGTVLTAEPIATEAREGLESTFSRKLSKKVILDHVLDKEILGGLVVNIGGRTFDGSLKTSINKIKETLERQ